MRFAAVGDLMLGSLHPSPALPPNDGADFLKDVTPLLSAADVAFGNLEAPLFDTNVPPTCSPHAIAERNKGKGGGGDCWAFRMPERYGALLRSAGFDVLSLANNHIDDFGLPGRERTVKVLDGLGLRHSGPKGTIAHLDVRGTTIDVIAFATYEGLNDLDDVAAAQALIRSSKAAIVVVSFHGGAEGKDATHVPDGPELYYGDRRGAVRAFAHAAIDAGADLVLGHGPHVVRGMEIRKGRLIAYSLGTFASWRGISLLGVLGTTMVLDVRLAPDGAFVGGRIHSVRQRSDGGPRPDPTGEAATLVRKLSADDFGERAPIVTDDGTLSAR